MAHVLATVGRTSNSLSQHIRMCVYNGNNLFFACTSIKFSPVLISFVLVCLRDAFCCFSWSFTRVKRASLGRASSRMFFVWHLTKALWLSKRRQFAVLMLVGAKNSRDSFQQSFSNFLTWTKTFCELQSSDLVCMHNPFINVRSLWDVPLWWDMEKYETEGI